MRAVVQRVQSASVSVGGEVVATIGAGVLVLLGVEVGDTDADLQWLARKILGLRIFAEGERPMERSIVDVEGEVLLVSQFTLLGDARKGNRPSYIRAARPEEAVPLYEAMRDLLAHALAGAVHTGRFGADMQVALVNDGPVTILLDSRQSGRERSPEAE